MIIAFFNNKGGIGKTSSCAAFGSALRERGHSVALFTLDRQRNLGGGKYISTGKIEAAIEAANCEFNLIDCPPGLNARSRKALSIADKVLIPMEAEGFAVEGLASILKIMKEFQSVGRDVEYRILFVRIDSRLPYQAELENFVRASEGATVMQARILFSRQVGEANIAKQSVIEHAPKCAAANAYRAAAKELTG